MRGYFRRLRRWIIRHQWLLSTIVFLLSIESVLHVYSYRPSRPSSPLDEPFNTGCREPDVSQPRENAAIVMLARNKERQGAISSIRSLEKQWNRWYHYPIVFLNDEPWEQKFIDDLTKVASGNVTFEQIPSDMWGFPDWMDQEHARKMMKKQDDRGVLYAGMESYHHMCRYNSGYDTDRCGGLTDHATDFSTMSQRSSHTSGTGESNLMSSLSVLSLSESSIRISELG